MTAGAADWMRGLLGGRKARVETASQATTGGGRRSGDPVEVYRAVNEAEAMVVKGLLESDGMPVMLRWESMGPVLALNVTALAEVAVLVPEPLAPRAVELLEEQARLAEAKYDLDSEVDDEEPPPDS